MDSIEISLSPFPDRSAQEESHRLGNIADGIWRKMVLHDRYEIRDGTYVAIMRIAAGHQLRKKDRDELLSRINRMNKSDETLNAKVTFLD